MRNIHKINAVRAVIDCPVCFSGNTFYLDSSTPPLFCDDCNFILADSVEQIRKGICIFCGNDEYYVDPPLVPIFFQPSLVCYVCTAEYKGIEANQSDEEFNEETANSLRVSKAAQELNERVELYKQQ